MVSEHRNSNNQKHSAMPVLKPFAIRPPTHASAAHWLANLPPLTGFLLFVPLIVWPLVSHAAGQFNMINAFEALIKWIPFLFTSGFLFNVLISMFSMLFGTIAGAALGLGQISQFVFVRPVSYTHLTLPTILLV